MKFKVKYRVVGPDRVKRKYSINLEEGATFHLTRDLCLGGRTGLSPDSVSIAVLYVRGGSLYASQDQATSGFMINGHPSSESVVRPGDFLEAESFVLEFLEAPCPQEADDGTQFLDVADALQPLQGSRSHARSAGSSAPAQLPARPAIDHRPMVAEKKALPEPPAAHSPTLTLTRSQFTRPAEPIEVEEAPATKPRESSDNSLQIVYSAGSSEESDTPSPLLAASLESLDVSSLLPAPRSTERAEKMEDAESPAKAGMWPTDSPGLAETSDSPAPSEGAYDGEDAHNTSTSSPLSEDDNLAPMIARESEEGSLGGETELARELARQYEAHKARRKQKQKEARSRATHASPAPTERSEAKVTASAPVAAPSSSSSSAPAPSSSRKARDKSVRRAEEPVPSKAKPQAHAASQQQSPPATPIQTQLIPRSKPRSSPEAAPIETTAMTRIAPAPTKALTREVRESHPLDESELHEASTESQLQSRRIARSAIIATVASAVFAKLAAVSLGIVDPSLIVGGALAGLVFATGAAAAARFCNPVLKTQGTYQEYLHFFAWMLAGSVPWALALKLPDGMAALVFGLLALAAPIVFALQFRPRLIPFLGIGGGCSAAAFAMLLTLWPGARGGANGAGAPMTASAPPQNFSPVRSQQPIQAQAPVATPAPVVVAPTAAPMATPAQVAAAASPEARAPASTEPSQTVPRVPNLMAEKEFFTAVRDGDLTKVRALFDRRLVGPNATLNGGQTGLMLAAAMGRIGIMEYLLGHGANIDAQDLEGGTALMWAVFKGHREAVKMLLRGGANISIRRKSGDRAVDLARKNRQLDLVQLLGG